MAKDKQPDLPEKAVGGKPISRQAAYSKASAYFPHALESIVDMLSSKNPSVKLGASKLIFETVLPPKVVAEIAGKDGGDLIVKMVSYLAEKKADGDTTSS